MNIHHPANSHHFNRIVAECVNFDALDPEWTTRLVFDFENDDKLGERENTLGENAFLYPIL